VTRQGTRLGKLYEGLTGGERAALVFAAAARLDKAEADRIEASVPRRIYRTLDADYGDRLDRLTVLGFFFGNRYWREFAKVSASAGLMTHAWHADQDDLAEKACQAYFEAQGRLKRCWKPARPTAWTSRPCAPWPTLPVPTRPSVT
jgi:hypothetical protein